MTDKKYRKVRDHCLFAREYRGAAHSICDLKYSGPKKIPIVFNNGLNYDYHIIINELGEEFKKQNFCPGENTEKYMALTVPIEKEITIFDKNEEEATGKYMLHVTIC